MQNRTNLTAFFIRVYPISLWKINGYFTDDYITTINEHWLQFEPQTVDKHYTLAIIYIIIMIFGIIGNLLVIYIFMKCKTLRTSGNYLIINLALADLLMISKMPIFIYNSFYLGPALGDIACQYYGFIGGLSGTCAICTLSAISLDRYYIVKFPLSCKFSKLRAKVCILLSWLYAVVFASMPLIPNAGLGRYVPEGFLTSCSFDYLTRNFTERAFIVVFFIAAWLVPFFLITFSYINILCLVKSSRNIMKTQQQKVVHKDSIRHIKAEDQRKQDLKLAFVALQVIALWFLAWTPYSVVALIGVFDRSDLISPMISMLPAMCCKIASCFDPIVYALSHPRFRAELGNIFCFSCKK